MNRLSIWRRSSSSILVSAPFGSEKLLVGLANLTELYGCVHELLESPYVRNTLRHHQKGKLLEDSLNGSVVLLDVCEAAREVVATMREHMMNLKSALRRKGSVEKEVRAYINVRKKAKKEISKHLNGLKKMETIDISPNIDQDPAVASTSVLRETIEISVSILRHLLLFLSTTPPPSPPPARKIKNIIGLFPIPLASRSLADRYLDLIKEAKSLDDVFLGSLEKNKRRDIVEESFGDLETELDSVFKCLVKNRVLFLNILKFMEEMLDGSLRLMDICNISRDLMVETHEHVRGVQSRVRRKKVAGGGTDQLDVAVSGYVRFRKNMRKEAKKLLGSLKKFDGGSTCSSSGVDNSQPDEHLSAVIDSMRRVVSVTVSVLKSFLEFLSGRQSSIKSKLTSVLKKKKVHHEETKNELESLDSAICCSRDDLQNKLEGVEMSIDGFEKYLEGLFRRLIRTRASLLNIISH
ncbi:hypothetical protein F2Q68_00028806 [Brassica cretica]|uniref:Uncharacterized protein n=1 Tax=Brassica cretica TaxID=69181 RepID=A0A8S9GD25_BRACR|nr:hypothetical protein F2Q68_00028806 [Brassica cretica]